MANPPVAKLTIKGNPYERGYQHGSQAREMIHNGVAFYRRMWEENIGRSREDLLDLAAEFEPVVGNYDTAILEEMEGVAAGAGLSLAEVMVINARYELMLAALFNDETEAPPGECTALAVGPEATVDGHTFIAQNWDWVPQVRSRSFLLEIQQEDRPDILTHVEAGFMGHKGLNSEGLGLCANAMSSKIDRFAAAVPAWVLARSVLNCSTLSEVQAEMERAERTASVNFMVATRQGEIAAVEVSPIDVQAVGAAQSRLAHGNVFADLSPERGLEDRLAELYPQFCDRADRAGGLMAEDPIDVERLKAVLSDHGNRPESICRHHEDQPEGAPAAIILETVVSVIMDLTEGTLYITGGPPCQNPYAEHRLTHSEHAGAQQVF